MNIHVYTPGFETDMFTSDVVALILPSSVLVDLVQ